MLTNTEMRAIDLPSGSRAITVPESPRGMSRVMARPSAAHQRLIVFVGAWKTGRDGTCIGEWMPGERAVILRWNACPGDAGPRDLWVMTPDARPHTYALHRFDEAGRAFGYQAEVEGDTWRVTGQNHRGTIVFADGGNTMTQQWEVRQGGSWVAVRELRAARGKACDPVK